MAAYLPRLKKARALLSVLSISSARDAPTNSQYKISTTPIFKISPHFHTQFTNPRLSCRISGSNTMSEVHARGAAKAAGLLEGWLVKAINGKRVTLRERVRQTACWLR
jgi:hypothetical protein